MIQSVGIPRRALDRVYVALAKAMSLLPNFRGKVRLGLALHRLFGLRGMHVQTDAMLCRPLKYRQRLDLHCPHERMALLMGGFEPEVSEFLAICHPGKGYALDIGANIGLITIPLALMLRTKTPTQDVRVWSIEPIQSNCAALRYSIGLNHLESDVAVLECCVGAVEGTVDISVEGNLRSGEGTGTANVLPTGTTYECERIAVPLTTIDALVDSGRLPPDCALIKIDCDGYDYNVLRGAATLLATARPIVFGEFERHCLDWHGQTHAEVVQFMSELGYSAFRRSGGMPLRFVPYVPDDDFERDLLFVSRESVDRFDWCLDRRTALSSVATAAIQ
jgi:FkbM family methyltransferase